MKSDYLHIDGLTIPTRSIDRIHQSTAGIRVEWRSGDDIETHLVKVGYELIRTPDYSGRHDVILVWLDEDGEVSTSATAVIGWELAIPLLAESPHHADAMPICTIGLDGGVWFIHDRVSGNCWQPESAYFDSFDQAVDQVARDARRTSRRAA